MRIALLLVCCFILPGTAFCWGFYAHQRINYLAVFLLPPEMMVLYKPNIQFLTDHSVDPDKRRYAYSSEGPRHYIDIDLYGSYPYNELPKKYDSAIQKFSEDTVLEKGIVPWWIQTMQSRLTTAFKERNAAKIIRLSAEIGHYIADSHVPLHTNSNHDGQLTNQRGIHGFWESRLPELFAEKEFDFILGKASYIADIEKYTWNRIMESAAAADSVLQGESTISKQFPPDRKFAFEQRNGKLVRQYSSEYSGAFNKQLKGMVERRMCASIVSVASFWYTAWINAGQPDLKNLESAAFSNEDLREFELLNEAWKSGTLKGRSDE